MLKFTKLFVLMLTLTVAFSSCKKKEDAKPGIADGYWDFTKNYGPVLHKVGSKIDVYKILDDKNIKKQEKQVGVLEVTDQNMLKYGYKETGSTNMEEVSMEIVKLEADKLTLKDLEGKEVVIMNVKDFVVK